MWKKIKEHGSKRSVDSSKAEDDLRIDMEMDLCGFTDEGDMIVATESVVKCTDAAGGSVVDVGGSTVDVDDFSC